MLQEFHTQHKAAPKISPYRTQRARRGRVVGTEVDAQQADSQGRPRGVIVAQTSGGGREQPADDSGIRIRGGRSRRRRRRRLRLRLRPRPRPRALLETSLQLSHDARVQGVALFKLGGEVGRVLPLQVQQRLQPGGLSLLLEHYLVQLLEAPRRAELAFRPPAGFRGGGIPRGSALARGLQLELGCGELQRELLGAGLSGRRRGGRLRPAPRGPAGRQPPPEFLQILPQVGLPQFRGGALLLVARRGLPGLF